MSISSFFKKIVGGESNKAGVIGLDIGSSAIKVVELEKSKGKVVLKTYGELALGPYARTDIGRATHMDTPKLSQALGDILREAKTQSIAAGVAIPLLKSLISILELPESAEEQLSQIVPIEARKYIPVAVSEVSLSWVRLPKEMGSVGALPGSESGKGEAPVASDGNSSAGNGKIDVLLTVIHNDAINDFQNIIKANALSPRFYEVESFSTVRAVLEKDSPLSLIFDMGAGTTKLYIVDGGVIRASHVVSRGSQDISLSLSQALDMTVSHAEELKRSVGLMDKVKNKNIYEITSLVLITIFAEVSEVMAAYEKKHGKRIDKIYLAGGGALLKGIIALAKESFDTPVVLADPFSKVDAPAFFSGVLKVVGPEFAVALGTALRALEE